MSEKQGTPTIPPLNGGGSNNGGSNGGAPQQTVSLQQVLATAQSLNVLTSGGGQQFVITSQVPGLTQVLPSGATTNASLQQLGVTRIVNIGNSSPRVSVVAMPGASNSTIVTPSRQTPTKVVLTTSPKLVRTSIGNMFVTPTSGSSTTPSQSSPARKRLKISESVEKSLSVDTDVVGYRRWIMEHKIKRMRIVREKYAECASELFFLCAGGNIMDYPTWKKRSPTSEYLHFLRQHRLDPDDDDEDLTVPLPPMSLTGETSRSSVPSISMPTSPCPTSTPALPCANSSVQSNEVVVSSIGVTPISIPSSLATTVTQINQQGQIAGRAQGGRHGMVFAIRPAVPGTSVTIHPSPTSTIAPTIIIGGTSIVLDSSKSIVSSISTTTPVTEKSLVATHPTTQNSAVLTNQQPVVKLIKLPPTTMASSCDTPTSKEQIVEKAKQEAYVMQRVVELQREGLWSERRLPKLQEPGRTKAHWDYLLEEMVWLAADFAQERKWKKAAAKKCARMVQKHFQEKAIQAQKAEKLQELRLKKIAGFIAKEIKTFWTNVEKLVEYKQQTRLEEKRKKVLDQHLNFIVGQTEKYSTWLTEGLNKTEGSQSVPASINSSRISSPVTAGKQYSDDEFEPNQSSEDDEETIAKAEEEMKSTNHIEEVELLKKESELPLEDLLKELPPNYLEERDKSLSPAASKSGCDEDEDEEDAEKDEDGEFKAAAEESSDDEDTIMEQENQEKNVDHKQELDDLKAENEMSIEELMAKYSNLSEVNADDSEEESENESEKEDDENEADTSNSSAEEDEEKMESSQTQSEDETGVGLKSLLEDFSSDKLNDKSLDDHSQVGQEMDDVAALAESIQPKGNTLLTTSVVTKIPFLLKHSLREYQHIGLDWLVTMYERKLNGILADEMGLGKTIQTIALLAHLACEKGNWGPHLIIVPTSVMLNWEMECKKWCPGFKILTYYGTQKERKQKRTGWTKPNAFHICITSYKLVIQDHQSFRRKKWKYLILDEAQNIKNFKSQRWQLLLNFQTQRRLLLTGTPLQNNLMELWSLMHFLMPSVFQSHREFKEWFSNPVTGMIEGNSEYNENIIRRLHKVLRPFLLRRLKSEVEKQLPKKYEHIVMCRLSKRQRFLYDDFMSRAKTKETLASGNLLSVINVLMQLRKVCNHPNLFEVRPTVSPFQMEGVEFVTASLVWSALDYDPFKHVDLFYLNLMLVSLEGIISAYTAHRMKRCKTPRKLIEEIDNQPEPPPRCPPGKIKINVRLSNEAKSSNASQQVQTKVKNLTGITPTTRVGTSPLIKSNQASSGQGVTLRVADGQQLQGYSVQLVPHQGSVKAIPMNTIGQNLRTSTATTSTVNPQRIAVTNANVKDNLQRIATQTVTVKQGDSVQRIAVPNFAQLVQTSTGKHIILTSNQQNTNAFSLPVVTSSCQRLTVLPKSLVGLASSTSSSSLMTTTSSTTLSPPPLSTTSVSAASGKPLMRVPPLNISASSQVQLSGVQTNRVVGKVQKDEDNFKEQPKSQFFLPQLEDERKRRRQEKLKRIADINEQRCAACPLYGEDLFLALRIGKPATSCQWHNGSLRIAATKEPCKTRRQFFSRTEALAEAIKSTEKIVEELKGIFERFVVCVPAVQAPSPRFHVSHPPPHKLWAHQRLQLKLQKELSPKLGVLHPVASRMMTLFPDPRLIQYDCGKLQSLDLLLRKLKSGSHRVLIFTQMTRMLDVLEAFLNYHGHIYLRLDGATKVDQRQILMERFNGDKRIFCFILSTRSGGVGVNLTGADTVIFYDSDWNPTMDAQAQDRCHRIGQTRDVHIYRLVSEKTVEENILKKANQKRLLGDLAIEGGNFTTAYFKNSTIQDLFNIDSSENDASARMAEILDQNKEREKSLQKDVPSVSQQEEKLTIGALENALAAAEEDLDVQAAKTAKAEAVAELAEFDENIPLEDAEKEDTQISKAELEMQNLMSQLTGVERYAMNFVEECDDNFSSAQLAAAERKLEEEKKVWELDRIRAQREEEHRRLHMFEDDEDDVLLTYSREDAQNQVNNPSSSKKVLVNKRFQGGRRGARRGSANNTRINSRLSPRATTKFGSRNLSSDNSESEDSIAESTNTDTETESTAGEDFVNDSTNEQSSDSLSQDNEVERGIKMRIKINKLDDIRSDKSPNNGFDLNSPRTRSRGNVKINLWTLDDSPIMPVTKYKPRGLALKRAQMNAELARSSEHDVDSSSMHEDSESTATKSGLENGVESGTENNSDVSKKVRKKSVETGSDSCSSMSPTVYLTRSQLLKPEKVDGSPKNSINHDKDSDKHKSSTDKEEEGVVKVKPKNPVGRPRKRPLEEPKKLAEEPKKLVDEPKNLPEEPKKSVDEPKKPKEETKMSPEEPKKSKEESKKPSEEPKKLTDESKKSEKVVEEKRHFLRSKPNSMDMVVLNKRVEIVLENCDNYKEVASPRSRESTECSETSEEGEESKQGIITRSSRISLESLPESNCKRRRVSENVEKNELKPNGDDRANVFAKPKDVVITLQRTSIELSKPASKLYKRRPDTPMPNYESKRSPGNLKLKFKRSPDSSVPAIEKTRITRLKSSTDNDLSINDTEKPQRTAKVVAILSLDSQTKKRSSFDSDHFFSKTVSGDTTSNDSDSPRKIVRKRGRPRIRDIDESGVKKTRSEDDEDNNEDEDDDVAIVDEAVT